MAIVFSLAGALYGNITYKPMYVANSTFVVNVFKQVTVETEGGKKVVKTSLDLSTANSVLENLKVLVLSDRIIEKAIASNPDITLDVETIKSITTITSVEDTSILKFSVTHADPQVAYDVVNAITDVAPSALKDIESKGELALIDEAKVPSVPTSVNKGRSYAITGFVAAVALFLGVIFLLDFMSSTIKDATLTLYMTGSLFSSNPSISISVSPYIRRSFTSSCS
jgi:capsular polysaccharide biosynthesis protein